MYSHVIAPTPHLLTTHPLYNQGALLLVLFRVAHAVEHALTRQARGNLAALMAGIPDTAVLVDTCPDTGRPLMERTQEVVVGTVEVGSRVLVRPGMQVCGGVGWGIGVVWFIVLLLCYYCAVIVLCKPLNKTHKTVLYTCTHTCMHISTPVCSHPFNPIHIIRSYTHHSFIYASFVHSFIYTFIHSHI